MTYGVSTSLFRDRDLGYALRTISEVGFRQVELLCADHPPGEWYRDATETRRLLERNGLRARTVHSHPAGWNNAAPEAEAVRFRSRPPRRVSARRSKSARK